MSKVLIYLFAVFALWMYFSFGTFGNSDTPTIEDFDKAGSGKAGTTVAHKPVTGSNFKIETVTTDRNGFGGGSQATGTANNRNGFGGVRT